MVFGPAIRASPFDSASTVASVLTVARCISPTMRFAFSRTAIRAVILHAPDRPSTRAPPPCGSFPVVAGDANGPHLVLKPRPVTREPILPAARVAGHLHALRSGAKLLADRRQPVVRHLALEHDSRRSPWCHRASRNFTTASRVCCRPAGLRWVVSKTKSQA
jgi:hypothetical protein